MRLPERALPVRMERVGIVAPASRLRDVLVVLAELGVVELVGPLAPAQGEAVEALRRVGRRVAETGPPHPALAVGAGGISELERRGARDLLAGEVELARHCASAVRHGPFGAWVGWVPADQREPVAARLASHGAAVVSLRVPHSAQPPTLLARVGPARAFRPLVTTYGAVSYADIDPTPFAALAFVVMFGMMFGDVGGGLLLVLAGALLRRRRRGRLAPLRFLAPFALAAGAAAIAFGLLYGELFGPTAVLPTLWLEPLESPLKLLVVAVAVGVALLAASHAIGAINAWRVGGPLGALTAPAGGGGLALLVGLVVLATGIWAGTAPVTLAGAAISALALVALEVGFRAASGIGGAGSGAVELADSLLRLVANVFSFTRLAAFGIMHAAIGKVVLDAARPTWGGLPGSLLAVVVFVLGGLGAFALEALVVAVQALRLEYYELFSRVFAREGRPFSPWSLPVVVMKSPS